MGKTEIRYLLGIDGGGTKTEFLLTDTDLNEIRRLILGASNPVNAGLAETFAVLEKGINEICAGISLSEISVFAGIAGSGSEDFCKPIKALLSSFGFGRYSNGSDTQSAICAALDRKNGTAVIMGTGIVAFGSLDGKQHRSGGWGYMIDKGGSAFCYGSDALNLAFEFTDGRNGSRFIAESIEKMMGKPLTDCVSEIYKKGPSFVASFAPVIFEAYELGDEAAKNIIERNTYEAAKIIRAACKNSEEKKQNVVIIGGLCAQKEILLPFLQKHLGEEYRLRFYDGSTVNGALKLAKKLISE